MMKHLNLFEKIALDLKNNSLVKGVLLTGSVACGRATELSDLDIIALSNENKFVTSVIDGVLVEINYITYDTAIERLDNHPMEVYKYLDAKIEYDNGKLQEIISYAENVFNKYCISEKEKHEIVYWLKSTKLKLKAALSKPDMLMGSYLVSTNLWKVLEGIWAVNQKPIPPSSSLYRRYEELEFVPCQNWFKELLIGDIVSRGRKMIECIDWIIEEVNQQVL